MAVLKYKSNGTIKTLGITESGASSVTSVNGKTGAVTGLYDADNQPPYPVSSVNGKTGAVTGLYDADNQPPYPVSSVNGKTGDVTGLYDADNPPPYPVSSVNGKTGAVTGLYDANNPPPYPVSSVNGKTGDVTGLYSAENPPPYPVLSVNGNTGVIETTIKDAGWLDVGKTIPAGTVYVYSRNGVFGSSGVIQPGNRVYITLVISSDNVNSVDIIASSCFGNLCSVSAGRSGNEIYVSAQNIYKTETLSVESTKFYLIVTSTKPWKIEAIGVD